MYRSSNPLATMCDRDPSYKRENFDKRANFLEKKMIKKSFFKSENAKIEVYRVDLNKKFSPYDFYFLNVEDPNFIVISYEVILPNGGVISDFFIKEGQLENCQIKSTYFKDTCDDLVYTGRVTELKFDSKTLTISIRDKKILVDCECCDRVDCDCDPNHDRFNPIGEFVLKEMRFY